MAEKVVNETTEMDLQNLMVPKFIKKEAGRKKPAFKSDIGMMISYHPEKSLVLRIPAYCWDDEKKYPNCTPLTYVQAKLNQKITDLNESDDEIAIKDFFKIIDSKGDLSALETAVTPVSKSPVIYEAIDFLMNDKDEGMNCEESPFYRANIHVNREKFVKDEQTVPLKLGNFFGYILFEPGRKIHIRYDWNTPNGVPYNVRIKFNPIIDCKRMQNNTGFYTGVDFNDRFYCISFNLREDRIWEFYTTEGNPEGKVNRYFAETKPEESFLDGLFNHPSKFFEIYSDKKYQNEISRFIEAAALIQKISIDSGEYVEDDNIFVSTISIEEPAKTSSKKKTKKSKSKKEDDEEETMAIGDMIPDQLADVKVEDPKVEETSDSEEDEFN